MADISKITLVNGTTYDLKDTQARNDIAAIQTAISGGVTFMGETTTALTDGAVAASIVINSATVTAVKGYLVVYNSKEFVFDGTKWIEMGDLSLIGDLGWKNTASGDYKPAGSITFTNGNTTTTVSKASSGTTTYQPEGSIDAPAISLKTPGSTTTVNSINSVGSLPTLTTTVSNEILTIAFDQGTLPTKGTDTTVKTGDAAYQASAPDFTGTPVRLVTGNISVPTSATFVGTDATITVR